MLSTCRVIRLPQAVALTWQFPPLPSSFDPRTWVFRSVMCVGPGDGLGFISYAFPTAGRRKFKSWAFFTAYRTTVLLAAGALDFFCLARVLGPASFMCHKEQNIPCGLKDLKALFSPTYFIYLVFSCTWPMEGFKAFFSVAMQPVTMDAQGKALRSQCHCLCLPWA